MKIYIREDQLHLLLKEMAYPVSFDLGEFKNLNSFSKRIDYCEHRLQRISSGSSRIVYKIDEDKCLKLAKNKKGISQNENEIEHGQSNYEIFAKVFDSDENGLWLEMELAKKCNPSDFKKIIGYDFNTVCEWIDYVHSWYSVTRSYFHLRKYEIPEKYKELFNAINYETAKNFEWFNGLMNGELSKEIMAMK